MIELASATSKQEFLKRLHELITKSEQDQNNQQDNEVGSSENRTTTDNRTKISL